MYLQSGRSVKINDHEIVELFKDGVPIIGIDNKVFDGSFESAIKTTINNNAIAKIEELKSQAMVDGEEKSIEDGMWDDEERGKYKAYSKVLKLLKGE